MCFQTYINKTIKMNQAMNSRNKMDALCLVCGDKASGRHYGVASCDGCRGFFKRSIRRNLDYICKEANHCIVDVNRRNQCQACRFRRCIEVNMKRDGIGAVQHERAPRGALKRSYPPDFIPTTAAAVVASAASPFLSTSHPPTSSPSISVGQHFYSGHFTLPWRPALANAHSFHHVMPRHFPPLPVLIPPSSLHADTRHTSVPLSNNINSQPPLKDDEVSSSAKEETLTNETRNIGEFSHQIAKVNILPEIVTDPMNFIHHYLDGRQCFNETSETAARLLFLSIRWIKTIPSFCHFSHQDQTFLLEEAWCELFLLTLAQWRVDLEEVNIPRNCSEMTMDRQEALLEGLHDLRQLISRIHLLRLDYTEFACLKALVLFKPETRALREVAAVELLQDQTQMMLLEYCSSLSSSAHSMGLGGSQQHVPLTRFGKILLLLPAIRAIKSADVTDLFFRNLIGKNSSINRLLTDFMASAF